MPRRVLSDDEDLAARRELVLALAAPGADRLARWLDDHVLQRGDLAWLTQQGLALFAFQRARQVDLLERLPGDVAAQWEDIYQQAMVGIASMDWEIERVLLALVEEGVDFLWMKGGALAYAVYPNPACRARGDLDLWVQAEQLPLAASVLQRLEYCSNSKLDRPDALALLVGGEHQMVNNRSALHLIELQWPAMRGEWVRHTTAIDHAAIWQRRAAIVVGAHSFASMTAEDTLIHLCLHQAINHQFSAPWLRNLLDVHLLVATRPLDWTQVVARAASWRLATVVWTTLSIAQRLLDTATPEMVMQALAPSRWRRWLIDGLDLDEAMLTMRAGGYGHRRFLVQMALVDRPRDGLRLLWRGLFPDASWLQARYDALPGQRRWRLRLLHVWRLITSARA